MVPLESDDLKILKQCRSSIIDRSADDGDLRQRTVHFHTLSPHFNLCQIGLFLGGTVPPCLLWKRHA